jgi:hypothetical protein
MTASAAVTRVAAAAPTRQWLAYPFTGVPARPGEAAAILAHNGRALLGAFGLLLIAQAGLLEAPGPGHLQRAVRAAGEAVLAGLIASNALLVGVALGAYGSRMARAMLPHGPVELAAFSLALALYLQGRHQRLASSYLIAATAASAALLAAAAVLETYVEV